MIRFASPLRVRPANVVEPRSASFITPQRLPPAQPVTRPARNVPARRVDPEPAATVWNNGMPFKHLPHWQPPEFDSAFLPVPDSPDPTPLQDPHRHFNWPTEQPSPARQRFAGKSERNEAESPAPVSLHPGYKFDNKPGMLQVKAVTTVNHQEDLLGLSPRFTQVRSSVSNGQQHQGPPSRTTSQKSVPVPVEEVSNVSPVLVDAEHESYPVMEVLHCQSLVSSSKSSNTTVAPQLASLNSSQSGVNALSSSHDTHIPARPLISTGLSWMPPSAETPRSARPHEETGGHSSMSAGVWQHDAWQCNPAQQEWQCTPAPWQQDGPHRSWIPVVQATATAIMPASNEEHLESSLQPLCSDDELSAVMAEVGDLRQQFEVLLKERDTLKKEVGQKTQESKKVHDQLCKAREELSDLLDASRSEMDTSFPELYGNNN